MSDDALVKKLISDKPLYIFALPQEAGEVFQNENVLFCGVGKVNAAYALSKQIAKSRPSIVINLGSAGSPTFLKDTVVCCTQFVQRDMDVTALGFEKYQTPFANDPVAVEHGLKLSSVEQGICGTGDNFEIAHMTNTYDVIDMEAYSLAVVCQREKVPFLCLKYITDGADGNAATDWNTALDKAAHKLKATIDRIKV